MNRHFKITLYFLYEDEKDWVSKNLLPEEYFDLDGGETIEIDCVPIHNHAVEYLNLNRERVKATKIVLEDSRFNNQCIITESFWNNQKNRVIERTDIESKGQETEIIIESEISVSPPITEIFRFTKDGEVLAPIYHGFIQTNPDGTEDETKIIVT